MANIKYRHARGAGLLLIPCALLWLAGCTGGSGIGDINSPSQVNLGGTGTGNGNNPVGNAACLQCHFSFPSNYYSNSDPFDVRYTEPGVGIGTGVGIGPNYQKGIHNSDMVAGAPMCETCHGDGGQHFGTGPIPRWAPSVQQCGACHTGPGGEWAGTAHANPNQLPDAFFGQGGVGAAQAQSPDGLPLFQADGITPVSKDRRIEECSSCHAYAQSARPKHIAGGDVLNPPNVACGSCHDSHSPALHNKIVTTTRPGGIPGGLVVRLKPARVNNNSALPQYGANNKNGVWVRPGLALPWHPATITDAAAGFSNDAGYATQATVVADSLRLNSEALCASCHTQGNWTYTAFKGGTPYTVTHNQDVYSQYRNSGHGNKIDVPYEEFSLLAPIGGSHRPQYPIDMGSKTTGRLNGGADNFDCYQCHNGIGTIDYLKGTQNGLDLGDSQVVGDAHIIYGDSTTTCVSCHDPHDNSGQGTGQKNVRIPKYLTYNKFFNDVNNPGHGNQRGGFVGMLDGTAIPANALGKTSLICLFCHQGRESGYTLYRNALLPTPTKPAYDLYTPPTPTVRTSYTNAHYFSGAAQLWSKNSFEYLFAGVPATYSNGIPEHQAKNCAGCHMAATTDTVEGGHTFKPKVETCRECHPGIPDVLSVLAPVDVDGDPTTSTVYQSLGTIDPTTAPSAAKTGLFNILNFALYNNQIEYDPDLYPYFFTRHDPYSQAWHTSAHGFGNTATSQWTPAQLEAAFNLGQLYKSGNAAYVHNFYYTSQILIDSLRALGVTTNPSTANAFVRPTSPPGGTTHQATDYRTIVVP